MLLLGQRVINNIREKIFGAVLRQEMAFFDQSRTGELINRLSADTSLVGQALTSNISDGLRALAQISVGISMMVQLGVLFFDHVTHSVILMDF